MKLICTLIFLTPLQTSPLKGRGFKVSLLMVILIVAGNFVKAQNDSIYPLKKTLHVGDTLKMVFQSKNGSMQLMSNGACTARLMHITQFKKPAGYAQIYQPKQMDCGLPFVDVPNGVQTFYPQMHPGTYRMVFFKDGKPIETEEFTVE